MALSYPYKQNEEDKEIPTLTFVDETMTPFAQLPPDDEKAGGEENPDGNDKLD